MMKSKYAEIVLRLRALNNRENFRLLLFDVDGTLREGQAGAKLRGESGAFFTELFSPQAGALGEAPVGTPVQARYPRIGLCTNQGPTPPFILL